MTDGGSELFRLVYASWAVVQVLPRFDGTVEDILAVARPKNERLGVTGMLVAHQGWFLQTLEGPRRQVSHLFGEIGRDLRHAQLELLGAGPAEERLFGAWSMYARKITPKATPILHLLDVRGEFDPFGMSVDKALRLLQAVAAAPIEAAA